MNKVSEESGFTLIETVVAIAVVTLAILALYGLVTTAIKGNASANSITTAANWAQDKVENVLAMDYADLIDTDGDGCVGLDDFPAADFVDNDDSTYTIYWNIASNCTLTDINDASIPAEEQKPKHIRIIVQKDTWDASKKLVLNYIKQNSM